MNPRERILAIVTGVFLSCFVGYILVRQLLLEPAAQLDAEAKKLTQEVDKLDMENRQEGYYRDRLRKLFGRSFGSKERDVGNALAKRLELLLNRSGFDNTNQSLTPVTGAARPGVYREIGRSVSVKGTLKDVTNFLYLLKSEPSLRRLDNLVLVPKQGGQVDLRFKYSTLVLTPRSLVPTPTTMSTDTPGADLDSKERKRYDVIAIRDLFRPYMKRPPAPPAPRPIPRVATPRRTVTPNRPVRATTPPVAPGRFKVVGLPQGSQEQKICVLDTQTEQVRSHRLGEPLAKGMAVMVDRRPLPWPDKPFLMSRHRVIVQIGPDFWAIELGQTLSDKRRLKPEELPEEFKTTQAPAAPPGKPDERKDG